MEASLARDNGGSANILQRWHAFFFLLTADCAFTPARAAFTPTMRISRPPPFANRYTAWIFSPRRDVVVGVDIPEPAPVVPGKTTYLHHLLLVNGGMTSINVLPALLSAAVAANKPDAIGGRMIPHADWRAPDWFDYRRRTFCCI